MLIYDGDCAFCTRVAQWLESRLTTPIAVVPWQQIRDLGDLGLTEHDVMTAAYWVDAHGRVSRGHEAIGRALLRTKPPLAWLGALALVPPTSWLAALAYPVIARYRHRLPGGTAACALPPTSTRAPDPRPAGSPSAP